MDGPAPAGPFGARLPRKEDPRLLRGEARFLDDIEVPPGTLHAVFLRSPHAHARILGIDASGVRDIPGALVLTAADLPQLPPLRPDLPLPGFAVTERPLLCRDLVRFVGDCVAIVLAEDAYAAEDAAELVAVDYEPLPAIVTLEQALAEGAGSVHREAPDNVLFRNQVTTEGFDAAFAAAPHVFRETFVGSRVATVSLEPRGCLARHDPGLDETVLWSSTQVPHLVRNMLCEVLGLADTAVRVIAPDVGGGFGVKASVYPEEILAIAAARLLGRPVKWAGDRQDDFLSSSHARDMRFGVEMAMDADGVLAAIRIDVLANAGAYGGIPFGSSIEAGGGPRTFPGPYRFRHYAFRTRAVATHTTPSGPYRGVAAPIAFMAFEGMMDRAAAALGLTREEIRRRNLLDTADFPFVNASGIRYDIASHHRTLTKALALSEWEDFVLRRDADPDKIRGIGIACVTEQTGQGSTRYRARGLLRIPGIEAARLKMEPSGRATLAVSQTTQGQGHLTTFAQMAAEHLGIPPAHITVLEGDTAVSPFGSGTFASRSVVAAGGAVITAAEVIAKKMKRIAGHLLEADEADIVLRDGRAEVVGTGLSVTIEEVARTAYAMRPKGVPPGESFGLDTTEYWDQPFSSVSAAVHVAEVSIEKATGRVKVERYSIVHDCGRVVNPMIVDGQVHGAVVQGLGPALMERLVHDEHGQLLTTTLLDYTLPTALDVPDIAMEHIETPALDTKGGVKGMAEGGTIGAIPVLLSAINDALRPHGAWIHAIPVRAEQLLRIIRTQPGTPEG